MPVRRTGRSDLHGDLSAIGPDQRAPCRTAAPSSTSSAQTMPKEHGVDQRILVPCDGGPTSRRSLQEAIGIARLAHGRLCLVHVIDELARAYAGAMRCAASARYSRARRGHFGSSR
ncbi:universal stress protein [Variovorax paradoxus]|uniref:universal stress protein n=1 Tax=Variovorax paradoxus TaxID=34073 RepID=UPI002E36E2A9|nr:universal stress protein [Variovorax paradoxus]